MPSNSKKAGKRSRVKTSASEIERHKRMAEMLELRKQGYTIQEIADNFKIAANKCSTLIKNALEASVREPADHVRRLMIERHEMLLGKVLERALNGDMFAVDRALAIMNQQARLDGFYLPEKIQVEETGKVADAKAALLNRFNSIASKFDAIAAAKTAESAKVIEGEAVRTDETALPAPTDEPLPFRVDPSFAVGGRIG